VHQTLAVFLHSDSSSQRRRGISHFEMCEMCCTFNEGRPLFPHDKPSDSLHITSEKSTIRNFTTINI
jgi:hypothetical protein